MRLKRIDVLNIFGVLVDLAKSNGYKPFVFKYVSKKIREILNPEIEAIKEVEPKLYKEYQQKINQIYVDSAKKDENGQLAFVAGANPEALKINDLIIEDSKTVAEKISELNAQTDVEAMQKEVTDYDKFMVEEIEIDLPKIKVDNSEFWDTLSDKEVEILFPVVEE